MSHGLFPFQIIDYGYTRTPALSILVPAFASFPTNGKAQAETMCNSLNIKGPGKLTVDEDMYLNYSLFYLVGEENRTSDDLRSILSLAVDSFEQLYPIVMLVRWRGMTTERAFQISSDKKSSDLQTLMGDVLDAIKQDDEDETDTSGSDESSEGEEK